MQFDAILALGANIGDKRGNIAEALRLIEAAGDVRVLLRSRDFKTPPWGKTDQPWFVNACAGVATQLKPHALLERCLAAERKLGRVRSEKWGPRTIDIDVLVHKDGQVEDDTLVLPHPRITERAFVLAPLSDIAPDLVLSGKPVSDWLLEADTTGVEPFDSEED
ncbi:MAG: 2-amino-4-hydroxy-6-hydroxymethyldihydropteridine diphosphokinase [Hyphomicrobiaceae bacterium]